MIDTVKRTDKLSVSYKPNGSLVGITTNVKATLPVEAENYKRLITHLA